MIKTFCDACDQEIKGANDFGGGRLRSVESSTYVGLLFEVTTGRAPGSGAWSWNAGHWCKYCILDAIAKLDDRPKPDVADAWEDLNPVVRQSIEATFARPEFSAKAMYNFMGAYFGSLVNDADPPDGMRDA